MKWISVEDRLPEASAFNPENNSVEVLLWQYGRYELGRIWFKHIDDYEVTHWMPLPEPPAPVKEP